VWTFKFLLVLIIRNFINDFSVKMKLILKLVVIFCWTFSNVSSTYSKSRVYLDKETGGYNDLTVVISSELKASDCPRILEDIKVFV